MYKHSIGPRAEYREQQGQRVIASPTLAAKYRKLKSLKVSVGYFAPEGITEQRQLIYDVNLGHAKSVFRLDCSNGDCIRGDHELTKALAAFLFDDETAMVRLDMSEYMEKHSVARLIGAPPGYVGYEEGGALTEAVRRRPYQVVLFDEIEKAHPDVFNVLLQVLDDGRLTDGQGRTVDFKNTLVIMTSNLGSEFLVMQKEGEDSSAVHDEVMQVVRAHFRPEFLNRIDEIILFNRLARQDMGAIVDIQFMRLEKLLADRKITLALDAKARDWLAAKGYDSAYGARPLKRVMQKELQDALAERLLAGEIPDGANVAISADAAGLTLDGRPAKARVRDENVVALKKGA